MTYIRTSKVKALCKSLGKRTGKDFLTQLNMHIEKKITEACKVHNGGKITLDGDVAVYVGIRGF